jgi:hypothetical protein
VEQRGPVCRWFWETRNGSETGFTGTQEPDGGGNLPDLCWNIVQEASIMPGSIDHEQKHPYVYD